MSQIQNTMVKTRIAPSPTGWLHIGTARTALFNYLYAKRHGGQFVIRVEDTDRERSTKEFEDNILEGLAWLGLTHDEFVRQSERLPRHIEILEKMIAEGHAYVSEEPSKADESKTVSVVRLKNPGKDVTFTDEIRGEITFNTTELGDTVIARAIDDPLYHLAVVVDDMDMEITHVIRGEDHISNTARQILIQEAIGAPRPVYAHLPLILGSDRSKLSKRHGATSINDYRDEGFLPEGFINYLALLGWSTGTDEEDFSLEELSALFDLDGVHKGGAMWDRQKLLDVNQRWMRKETDVNYIVKGNLQAPDQDILRMAVPLLKERAKTFSEAQELLNGELACLFTAPTPDKDLLLSKGSDVSMHLEALCEVLSTLSGEQTAESVKETLMPYADSITKEDGGRGAALWPLRYALSGLERSPDPFTLIAILGLHESASRVRTALGILQA
ncbi:glutamate--tRNA ligase [Patescibacteria group bacterium]|nr:glutamate--tRNA ligase [Patescibacteria group bacterium]MBU1755099.1 glutamate--tRNA ligase [Patescibacteria group bacterium]